MDDSEFLAGVVEKLAGLPGVEAVALGGSRATGEAGQGADWDLAVYYRDVFEPQDLRDLGWPGEVSEIGGWGGGIYNGGAWLTIDGRQVDVHYRDLTVVEEVLAGAELGRFRTEALLFHLAGIPDYLLLAELAINQTLAGTLPRPAFPRALRETAPPIWWGNAKLVFGYAEKASDHGRATQMRWSVGHGRDVRRSRGDGRSR